MLSDSLFVDIYHIQSKERLVDVYIDWWSQSFHASLEALL